MPTQTSNDVVDNSKGNQGSGNGFDLNQYVADNSNITYQDPYAGTDFNSVDCSDGGDYAAPDAVGSHSVNTIDGQASYTKTNGSTGTLGTVTLTSEAAGYAIKQTVTHNGDGSTTIDNKALNPDGSVANDTKLVTSADGKSLCHAAVAVVSACNAVSACEVAVLVPVTGRANPFSCENSVLSSLKLWVLPASSLSRGDRVTVWL